MLQKRVDRRSAERAACALIFSALGDETRLRLVSTLADGQARSIAALTEGANLTRQAVTKHLRMLESAGVVSSTRTGRESRFQLAPECIVQAQSYLGLVSAEWDAALGRLKDFVER